MKTSRVQEVLKILNAHAEEFILEEKSKSRKYAAPKKAKKVVKKPRN
jgi:hypothetical protein